MKPEQTKVPRVILEGPQPCTIVCFAFMHELRNQSISIGQFLGQ